MKALAAYLANDRRLALANCTTLPDRALGAVLSADISGFTPATEALVHELGPQQGAEELTRLLNQVYDQLITQVEAYGGSVVGFSGDGITCWFAGDSGVRAVASGLALQAMMEPLTELTTPAGRHLKLALKVAVAAGVVRRFVVGQPDIQYLDVLAGSLLERLAQAEHQARPGEVVALPEVVAALGQELVVREWGEDPQSQTSWAVLSGLKSNPPPGFGGPPMALAKLEQAQLRRWLLPAVYTRLVAGQGDYLAELRPAVALFVCFAGLDYDQDEEAGTNGVQRNYQTNL